MKWEEGGGWGWKRTGSLLNAHVIARRYLSAHALSHHEVTWLLLVTGRLGRECLLVDNGVVWCISYHNRHTTTLAAVAKSVERIPHVWEIRSLVPGRVKPMTYQIDTCRFLAWCSALIGYGKISSVSGQCDWVEYWVNQCVSSLISQWGSTIKSS